MTQSPTNSSKLYAHQIESLLSQMDFSTTDTHNYELTKAILDVFKTNLDSTDTKLITTAIEEFRMAFKIFQRYRDVRKVCLFGSARTKSDDPDYIMTEEICQKLTTKGYMTITGAGPGIMEAGNKGSLINKSFGLNILLPFEQDANKYIINSPKLVSFKYFFTRKLAFIKESDATVLFPGGFGTHDEGFEALTLIQTGRCAPRPVVLICDKSSDYWEEWIRYINNQLLERGYISPDDVKIYEIFYTADEAIKYIETFYSIYHSIRYTDQGAVIKLNKPLKEKTIDYLNSEFSHLIIDGDYRMLPPFSDDIDQDPYPSKHSLVFNFNKSNYGGVCRLIRDMTTFDNDHT